MEDWKEVKFGDIATFKYGTMPKKEKISENGLYPIYSGYRIVGYYDEYNLLNSELIIVARGVGGTGDVKLSPEKCFLTNLSIVAFLNETKILKKYAYYYFTLHNLRYLDSGSAQSQITISDLSKVVIHLPPLATQKKIAEVLSSLDDKIELNNKINANLEQQAQTIFKSWFVDFEPFGGEKLVESPIDTMIPKSLKMVQIGDIPHILETGKRPKGGAVSEGVPSIGAENVKQLGVFDFSSNKYIPREYADSLGKGKINGYELLLYKDGGKPGTFIPHFSMFGEGFPYEECYINEHVFKLDFYDKGLNEFAYFYFNTDYAKSWLANNGGKAAIPGINQNDVNAVWIYDLENPKVKEFGKYVEPLFKQIFSNCKQNKELASIRDTLLPKLMNGEIVIKGNNYAKK